MIMTGTGAVTNGNENPDLSTCNQIDSTNDCDRFENRLPWHQLDWKSYIAKDLKSIHRYSIYGLKLCIKFTGPEFDLCSLYFNAANDQTLPKKIHN